MLLREKGAILKTKKKLEYQSVESSSINVCALSAPGIKYFIIKSNSKTTQKACTQQENDGVGGHFPERLFWGGKADAPSGAYQYSERNPVCVRRTREPKEVPQKMQRTKKFGAEPFTGILKVYERNTGA